MALQIDVHAALVLLRAVLQPKLLADLLHPWLDLLDVVWAVVALADYHTKVVLAGLLRVPDALFEDRFRFLHKLTVQIDGVARDFADRIVLTEDELRGLFVVRVRLRCMLFALLAQTVGASTIAPLIRLVCFSCAMLILTVLLTREISQAVIFLFRVGRWAMVEGLLFRSVPLYILRCNSLTTAAQLS